MFPMRRTRTSTPGPHVTGVPTADFARHDLRVDDFLERYVEWREECLTLHSADGLGTKSAGRARRGGAGWTRRSAGPMAAGAATGHSESMATTPTPARHLPRNANGGDDPRTHVVIAGGGVAGLEALLALRDLA